MKGKNTWFFYYFFFYCCYYKCVACFYYEIKINIWRCFCCNEFMLKIITAIVGVIVSGFNSIVYIKIVISG